MEQGVCRFTVLFQAPFWVGVAERWDGGEYQAAKVTFGPEPSDAQLYEWLQREWLGLRFSPPEAGERPIKTRRTSPKRLQREAHAAVRERGVSTQAQAALSRQREQEGLVRQTKSRQARQEEAEQKYLQRQQKKREKRRGR